MSTERKPKVDPKVPTMAIDRKLGRVHVGTPDAEVETMIRDAIASQLDGPESAAWTPAIQRQTIRYAIWRHHRNRQEYAQIMGPNYLWAHDQFAKFGHGGI